MNVAIAPMQQMSEAQKVEQNQEAASNIQEFLEWLQSQNIELCTLEPQYYDDGTPRKVSEFEIIKTSHEALIYQFFGIDKKKYEQEKADMLDQYLKNKAGA